MASGLCFAPLRLEAFAASGFDGEEHGAQWHSADEGQQVAQAFDIAG
jgi:hypothetical protein